MSYSSNISDEMTNQINRQSGSLTVKVKPTNDEIEEKIASLFKYKQPGPDDIPKFNAIGEAVQNLARVILQNTPECQHQTQAIANLTTVRMFANAAVATGNDLKDY
jgi:hypothetical protein